MRGPERWRGTSGEWAVVGQCRFTGRKLLKSELDRWLQDRGGPCAMADQTMSALTAAFVATVAVPTRPRCSMGIVHVLVVPVIAMGHTFGRHALPSVRCTRMRTRYGAGDRADADQENEQGNQ